LVSKTRLTKISERIREDLSEILLMESNDPRLKGITITGAEVDKELAYADIYVCAIEGIQRSQEVLTGLEHAQGYLRTELAHRMELRVFPRLRFHWDPTFEHADQIEEFQEKKRWRRMQVLQHELIATIKSQIKQAKKVLVMSHQRPDGDAIGSLLAMGLALINAGKNVQMVLKDVIPDNFRFLHGTELIVTQPIGVVDYIIVVDSAEIERIDIDLNGYNEPDLNIDHHKTNSDFAKINLVESNAVATAEILTKYLPVLGFTITKPIANALLTGIVTDTIGFRTTNVYPQVLRMIADLMDQGGDLAEIYYKTIVEQSLASARYWGAGLSKIQMENGLVWTTLSLSERIAARYPSRDDADLVKVLSAIEGAKVAVILTEQSGGYVKISWRLCGSEETVLDVSEIARLFDGGGHKAAAGADVKGKLNEVMKKVLTETQLSMNHVKVPIEGNS
jgi:phosphoesterase RecJ-like protein